MARVVRLTTAVASSARRGAQYARPAPLVPVQSSYGVTRGTVDSGAGCTQNGGTRSQATVAAATATGAASNRRLRHCSAQDVMSLTEAGRATSSFLLAGTRRTSGDRDAGRPMANFIATLALATLSATVAAQASPEADSDSNGHEGASPELVAAHVAREGDARARVTATSPQAGTAAKSGAVAVATASKTHVAPSASANASADADAEGAEEEHYSLGHLTPLYRRAFTPAVADVTRRRLRIAGSVYEYYSNFDLEVPNERLHVKVPITADANAGGEVPPAEVQRFGVDADGTPAAKITHAVVLMHGTKRNAFSYLRAAAISVRRVGADPATVLTVAPWFQIKDDKPKPGVIFWTKNDGWKCGNASDPGKGKHGTAGAGGGADAADDDDEEDDKERISSFAVMDELMELMCDARRFPNLRSITFAGHSAGGQFVQRYAITGHLPADAEVAYHKPKPPPKQSDGADGKKRKGKAGKDAAAAPPKRRPRVRVRFATANPSSYVYLDNKRFVRTNVAADGKYHYPTHQPRPPYVFTKVDPSARYYTPDYNRWKYGLVGVNDYARSSARELGGIANMIARFGTRDVTYMLGTADIHNDENDPLIKIHNSTGKKVVHGRDKALDKTKAAMLQGPWRMARGDIYYEHLQQVLGSRHSNAETALADRAAADARAQKKRQERDEKLAADRTKRKAAKTGVDGQAVVEGKHGDVKAAAAAATATATAAADGKHVVRAVSVAAEAGTRTLQGQPEHAATTTTATATATPLALSTHPGAAAPSAGAGAGKGKAAPAPSAADTAAEDAPEPLVRDDTGSGVRTRVHHKVYLPGVGHEFNRMFNTERGLRVLYPQYAAHKKRLRRKARLENEERESAKAKAKTTTKAKGKSTPQSKAEVVVASAGGEQAKGH